MEHLSTAPPAHELCATLIALSGMKRAEVARATGNNPANVSQWLQGRSKMLSVERQQRVMEFLGLKNGKLEAEVVHRWQVGNDFSGLRGILLATETPATLGSLIIHQVDTGHSHDARSPVLMAIPRADALVVILLERPASAGRHPLRLDAMSLGLGRQGADVQLAPDTLQPAGRSIPVAEFLHGVPIDKLGIHAQGSLPAAAMAHTDAATPDQLLAEKERIIAALEQDIRDLRCHEAGLRAVIRATLHALRESNDQHPLLEKGSRDRIYQEYYLADADKS